MLGLGNSLQEGGENTHDKRLFVRPLRMLAQEGRDEVDDPEGNADAGVEGRQEDEEGFERLARDERGNHCEGGLMVYGRVRRGVIILSGKILE